jgi:hypothetical protein
VSHVILQPAANAVAQRNFVNTIVNPVPLESNRDLLGPHYALLLERFPSGRVPMWGVVPGAGGINTRKYERLVDGDLVLFAAHGQYFMAGTVAYTWRSPLLAERLWGFDDKGQTWENMYALEDVQEVSIPYWPLNQLVGAEVGPPRGFMVIDEARSARVIEGLFPTHVLVEPEVTEAEYEEAIRTFDEDLDRPGISKIRKEQAYLRQKLLGKSRMGTCALCGETFPRNLLVTAHIKPRAKCDYEELRDFANIAMVACAFGCDDLYEKGYLAIDDDGRILVGPLVADDRSAVGRRLSQLQGRTCSAFTSTTRDYFSWHREHVFGQAPSSGSEHASEPGQAIGRR